MWPWKSETAQFSDTPYSVTFVDLQLVFSGWLNAAVVLFCSVLLRKKNKTVSVAKSFFIDHKMDSWPTYQQSTQTCSVLPQLPCATYLQWSWLIKRFPLSSLQEIRSVTHEGTYRIGVRFWDRLAAAAAAVHVEETGGETLTVREEGVGKTETNSSLHLN